MIGALRLGVTLAGAAVVLLAQGPAAGKEKIERAELWMAQQRFADAATLYEELVKAMPGNASLLAKLGMARHFAGDDAAALAPLEASLKLHPTGPALLVLGAAYTRLGQPGKAMPPLRRFVTGEPRHVAARQMLVEASMAAGDYGSAVTHLRKLTELEPGLASVWANLARAYGALARRTLGTLPATSAYFLALTAEMTERQERHRAAFQLYRSALEKMPRLRGLHQGLAGVYRRTGHEAWAAQEEDAERALGRLDCRLPAASPECVFQARGYQSLAASQSTGPEALYWRARAYDALSREALAKAGALPPSAEAWRFQAQLAREQGRHGDAVKAWHAAHALSPADESIEVELSLGLIAIKDFEEARLIADRLLMANPDSPEINWLAGELWLSQRQPAKALTHLEKAGRSAAARAALGQALLQMGRASEALPHLEAGLAAGQDASAHFAVAQALQAAGRTEDARAAMARYQQLRAKLGPAVEELEARTNIVAPPAGGGL